MSSIGSSDRNSHSTNTVEHDDRDGERRQCRSTRPTLLGCLDQSVDERRDPDDRQARAHGIEAALLRILRLGHEEPAADERQQDDRHVHEEHRAEPVVAEQPPARDGADRARGPGRAAQIAIALARSCGREHVHEDRERRRHDERGGRAHRAPGTRSAATSRCEADASTRSNEEKRRGRTAARPCARSDRRSRP